MRTWSAAVTTRHIGRYEAFVTAHGGSSNAFTECELTTYSFDIHPDFLFDGLDRFSQADLPIRFNNSTARDGSHRGTVLPCGHTAEH